MATETFMGTAAGDLTQLSTLQPPNWDAANDDDADTSYVYNNTDAENYKYDLYGAIKNTDAEIPSTAIPAGATINSVTIYNKSKGTSNIYVAWSHTYLKTNGGTGEGNSEELNTTYALKNTVWNTNPVTAAAWTIDDLDALQIGVGLLSGLREQTGVYYAGRCTWVYIIVDYTEAAAGQPYTLRVQQVSGMNLWG